MADRIASTAWTGCDSAPRHAPGAESAGSTERSRGAWRRWPPEQAICMCPVKGDLAMTTVDLPGTLLLDPEVIDDPYGFYRQLREYAPVWEAPGTGLYAV